MPYKLVLATFLLLIVTITTFAQDAPVTQPSPSPMPPVKRRGLDQFGLSNGIRVGGRSPSTSGTTLMPGVVESVDQHTYDGIERMVKYAAAIESEYRSSEGVVIDSSDFFEPYRVLSRKLPALYRIIEMFRAGLLEQPVLTNSANTDLLTQNQAIVDEMSMISNSTEAQLARNQPKLLPIAERYGAPADPVEKRPLLTAMFVRLNENFSRLKSQVVVKK